MIIKELKLKDFRNYESLDLKFNEKVNMIIGNNAQGKTNLIEAIYFSSIGKSFRTSKDSDLLKFEKDYAKIFINAEKEYDDTNIEIVISKKNKAIKINNIKAKKTSELLENIYVVIFSPEDLKMVKDEPEKRRKYIDRELCQLKISYYKNLSMYKKALLQRNALLKEQFINRDLLSVWDEQMIKYGSAVILQRKDFLEKIKGISKKIHSDITSGEENLKIEYEPCIRAENTIELQEILFSKELKSNIESDIKNRTTGKGPHKDDFNIEANGINLRYFGSQGQQRTAALSLKLAEIDLIKEETGEYPILLLDDVMSELDSKRQKYMIRALDNSQLFITTTEISEEIKNSFPDGKIIRIENGEVK